MRPRIQAARGNSDPGSRGRRVLTQVMYGPREATRPAGGHAARV